MSNIYRAKSESLKIIQGRMDAQTLPPSVRENFEKHYQNLLRVAGDLENLGMDQQQIDDHVIEIFNEYETELAANIRPIKEALSET